jgi:hypothetical protein
VEDPPPQIRTGDEVHAQIDALVPNEEGASFMGYGEEHMWTHKSGLTRLPYFDDLLLPHNIDVMHTEKNIAEALLGTFIEINKSKDNPKARVNLATLCDRPNQEMRLTNGGKTWKRHRADFVLARKHRREVLEWI